MPSRCLPLLGASLVLLTQVHLPGAAPQSGPDRWRSLARLPRVSLHFEFQFYADRGVVLMGDKLAWPDEIAALTQEIKRTPDDPEKHLRLGQLHRWLGDHAQSTQALARAASLLRQRLVAQPSLGPLHTRLGEALCRSGQETEAEAELRRGTTLAPEDWKGWKALGDFLAEQALRTLFSNTNGFNSMADILREYVQAEHPRKVPAENLNQARRLMTEAERSLDKAIALGVRQSEPYFGRACARGGRRLIEFLAHWDGNREQAAIMLVTFAYTPEAVNDLKEAARWSPKDPRLVGGVALFEAWTCAAHSGARGLEDVASEDWWRRLPETNRTSILATLNRLEALMQDPNPRIAAGAAEMLAALRAFIFRDMPGCETAARRAVTLDPTREQAWELLALSLVAREQWETLRRAAEDRLKARASVRNHILLAKACERLQQWKAVEQQVDAALAKETDDLVARLCRAVLLLKRKNDADLARAASHLKRIRETAPGTGDRQFQRDVILTSALCVALQGRPAEARALVEQVLKHDADDQDARQILETLPR